MKILLSVLTLFALMISLLGVSATRSSAMPVMHPQTSQSVAYWHHRHHHHHHGGLTIHL